MLGFYCVSEDGMKQNKLCQIKAKKTIGDVMSQVIKSNKESSAEKRNADFVRSRVHGRKQARWC